METGTPEHVTRLTRKNFDSYIKLTASQRTALRRLGKRHGLSCVDVEDVFQEASIRAWRFWHTYNSERDFFSWFIVIFRRCAMDFSRSKAGRKPPGAVQCFSAEQVYAVLALVGGEREILVEGPESLCATTEEVSRLLHGLSDTEKRVLYLHHGQGLAYEKVGRLLCIPASVVSRLARGAMAKIRERLNGFGDSDTD